MTLKCDRWPVSYLGGMHNYPIMRSMSKENDPLACNVIVAKHAKYVLYMFLPLHGAIFFIILCELFYS